MGTTIREKQSLCRPPKWASRLLPWIVQIAGPTPGLQRQKATAGATSTGPDTDTGLGPHIAHGWALHSNEDMGVHWLVAEQQ